MKNISQLLFCALILSIITIYASDGSNPLPPLEQALIEAVSNDNVVLTETLLNAKANPNAKIEYDITALQIAASRGNMDTVRLLLKHGAQAPLKNAFGQTALDFATMYGYSDIANLLRRHPALRSSPSYCNAGKSSPKL